MNDATGKWSRIETHEAILPARQPVTGLLTNEAIARFARSWTVKERFDRGSLRSALEAPDAASADRILDGFIQGQLPAVPLDAVIGNLPRFWLELAKANSCPRRSVWTKGHPLPKRRQIECAIENCIFADLIFELPNLATDQKGVQGPLLYFRDSGLLLYFIDSIKEGDLSNIGMELNDTEFSRRRSKIVRDWTQAENFRWEGFVIDALRAMSKGRAFAHYWRRDDNEIDLVLENQNRERWGVEITHGNPRSKPKEGFFRAEQHLQLSRRSVIARNSVGPVRRGVECLDLPQALHEVKRWLR